MKNALALATIMVTGVSVSSLQADEGSFKAYGFADVLFTKQWYQESNFLRQAGIVTPNAQLNLDHINTYFDWKPNSNIRVLAEVALNRDAAQASTPGNHIVFDSGAVYSNIYSQVGAATTSGILSYLQMVYPTLPGAALSHIADSMAQDTLSKTVHAIGMGVRAQSAGASTKTPKDHGISLPRVHADLLLSDAFNLRVGKFITPAGIWNVDHGSPAIVTVGQPIQTSSFPIFPENQTGVQAYGKTVFADQDFSYASWISTGRGGLSVLGGSDYGQDPKNFDDLAWGSHVQSDLSVLDGIRLGASFHTGTIREENELYNIPVVGMNLASKSTTIDLAQASSTIVPVTYLRELCYGVDSKIKWNRILVQGEWNHRTVLNLLNDVVHFDSCRRVEGQCCDESSKLTRH